MSSILRALKKLEEEGQGDASRRGWPQGVSPYVRIERKGGVGRLWLVGGLLAAAALLGVCGWLWTGRPSSSAGDMTAARGTVAPAAVQAEVAPAPVVASVPVPAPLPATIRDGETIDPRGLAARGHAVVAPERQAVADDAAVSDKAASRPALDARATAPVEPPRQNAAAEEEVPVLETPELALQAVAWSEVPAQRVAVVGNRVVKEGDFAFGYTVVRINPDDIVVRKQGAMGRILFKGR